MKFNRTNIIFIAELRVEKVGFDILMLLSSIVLKNCGLRGDLIGTEKAPACILA